MLSTNDNIIFVQKCVEALNGAERSAMAGPTYRRSPLPHALQLRLMHILSLFFRRWQELCRVQRSSRFAPFHASGLQLGFYRGWGLKLVPLDCSLVLRLALELGGNLITNIFTFFLLYSSGPFILFWRPQSSQSELALSATTRLSKLLLYWVSCLVSNPSILSGRNFML
jgi:hypothetical protein